MAKDGHTVLFDMGNGLRLADDNFAGLAEDVLTQRDASGRRMLNPELEKLSTSKIRSIYALITDVYMRAGTPEDFDVVKADLQLVKVRMAYDAGRDETVKTFLSKTFLMRSIDNIDTFDKFQLYFRYAESLIAYFKFYGGKDE